VQQVWVRLHEFLDSLANLFRPKAGRKTDRHTLFNYRMMREKLLKIVYWTPDKNPQGMPKPLARDRIEAAKKTSS
jgi:hypothetical protein